MSTSLLFHAFCIRDYKHTKTEYKKREVIFCIENDSMKLRCPKCGTKDVTLRGKKKRIFRAVPIG